MKRRLLTAVGLAAALLMGACSKSTPESDSEPTPSAEPKKLSSRAKARLDCDVAWPIFEGDRQLVRAFGRHSTTLEKSKERAQGMDQVVTQWRAAASKVQSEDLRKHGDAVTKLLEQRRAVYRTAIERAERGEPVPAPPKDKEPPKKKKPQTEREKALEAAAGAGMKGLLGEDAGQSIFSLDEDALLEINRRMVRDARIEVMDFCYQANYEPKPSKKKEEKK